MVGLLAEQGIACVNLAQSDNGVLYYLPSHGNYRHNHQTYCNDCHLTQHKNVRLKRESLTKVQKSIFYCLFAIVFAANYFHCFHCFHFWQFLSVIKAMKAFTQTSTERELLLGFCHNQTSNLRSLLNDC